ncbi:FAD-dependent monooxygenase [Dongia soli]|uniref:FAD-dependent monooxygenase n=1 Tax=Dongia soli TaxID=600628 RepID=A0ABU5EEH5_9PROT|nr:FAD-dependent monooxygenase [Dongia soli]MDY0884717.1 FAD-dependent monooxygenase [Dongia soli]
MTKQPQVLVAGAGPVGLTMAAELARYGIAVRIIDKATAPSDKSKALVVWSRTLELLDRAGCAEQFLAAGMPAAGANFFHGEKRLARVTFEGIESPFPYGLLIPQSETERLLIDHLAGLGVTVERGIELSAIRPDATGVSVGLHHPSGHAETRRVDWLIGCDGAHSVVRKALGLDFTGAALQTDWILADLHLDGLPVPENELAIFFHAEGVLATFPFGRNGRHRIIADLGRARSTLLRPDPTMAEIQAVIDKRSIPGIKARDPIWLSSFRINERKVADYRKGRVFLAGDAAHIHSPAGGQGMNTGMQDAVNLAWKLALVCRGEARAEALLDSYSAERSAVGEQVLRNAGRLTRIALLRNPLARHLRNVVMSLAMRLKPTRLRLAERLTELDIAYPDSPLNGQRCVPGGLPMPGDRFPVAGRATPSDTTSSDAAQPRISPPRFTVAGNIDSGEMEKLATRFAALLHPVVQPLPHSLASAGAAVWLLRPDGYIAIAGCDAETIGTYLERFLP